MLLGTDKERGRRWEVAGGARDKERLQKVPEMNLGRQRWFLVVGEMPSDVAVGCSRMSRSSPEMVAKGVCQLFSGLV